MTEEKKGMVKQHRSLRTWIKRGMGGLLVSIMMVVVGLFIYESLAEAATRRNFPPPGNLVDIGDYRLHLHVMGEDQGYPTVILEHGGISMSAQWGWVQPQLARHTRVVAYDRPGLGWSEAGPADLDAQQAVDDLYTALQQAGVEGPYVLVGHSMGGLMVRLFAHSYPDEVTGLVLVDPRNVAQHELIPWTMDPLSLRLALVLSRFGVIRLTGLAAQDAQGLPPHQFEQAVAIYPSFRQVRGWHAEGILGESATALLAQDEELADMPLVVLDAVQPDGAFDARQREVLTAQYLDLVARPSKGDYQAVEGAGHVTIVTQQEHAKGISEAVLDLLKDVSTSTTAGDMR